MKKILSILLLITSFGYSQSYLQWKSIQPAPANLYIPVSAASGTNTGVWTPTLLTSVIPSTVGLLPNTTSLSINGSTQSFTSTPSFTVGDLFSTSSYTNPSWLSSLAWSKITGTPTTLSGYGITDGVLNTSSITINGSSQLLSGSSFSVGNLNGSLTSGYVPYAVSSSSFVNSNIYFDGTNVGIGTPGPVVKLHVDGDIYTAGGTRSGGVAFGAYTFWGSASNEVTTNFSGTGVHLKLQDLGGGDVELSNASSRLKLANTTANSILYSDGSKYVTSLTLGSGLSLTSGTLTATGSGSTTIITPSTNITVTGTAPNYTISTPTQTTGLASITGTETLTNKRITVRTTTVTSTATITPNLANEDFYAVTSLSVATTFTVPTGTPTEGQSLLIRVKDNGTARALTFNAIYRFSADMPAPTTTVISKTMYLAFTYNSTDTKWDCVGLINNF